MQEETKKTEITWEEPEQLGAVPDMPDELLPPVIATWIQSIAKTYSCQQCVPAVLFMTLLSGVVGSRIGIKPYRNASMLVYPNMWGGVVGDPGSGKTPILRAVMQPFNIWNDEISKNRRSESAQREAELDAIDMELDTLKGDMKDASDADKETIKEKRAELITRRKTMPKKGRFGILQDATPEAAGEIMCDNPGGITFALDELAGELSKLDSDTGGSARALMLEGQNGGGSITVVRIKRGVVEIPSVTITLVGGIQPAKLGAYISKAISPDSEKNDGLIQRLQMVVCPAALPFVVRDMNDTCPQSIIDLVIGIDASLPYKVDENGEWSPLLINVNEEAHDAWCTWVQSWTDNMVTYEQSPHLKGHFSKFRSLMPSLSLLFALLDKRDTVTTGDMNLAGKWCDYMALHARRMYSLGAGGDTPVDTFIEKIRSGKITDGMKFGDIQRSKPLGRHTKIQLPIALKTLTDSGWIKFLRVGKAHVMYINPLVIKQLGINHD